MEPKELVFVPEDIDYEKFAEEWRKHDKIYFIPSDYFSNVVEK